ncbi:MAG: hypothetical protein ACETWT_18105, partial [Thermodesulfobacteriota bacterium]
TDHEQPKGQRCSLMRNTISFTINRLEKPRLKKSGNSGTVGGRVGWSVLNNQPWPAGSMGLTGLVADWMEEKQ